MAKSSNAENKLIKIGPENYYGQVSVVRIQGKCFIALKNFDSMKGVQITKTLFDTLSKLEAGPDGVKEISLNKKFGDDVIHDLG